MYFFYELALEGKGSISHFFVSLWPPARGGVIWEEIASLFTITCHAKMGCLGSGKDTPCSGK